MKIKVGQWVRIENQIKVITQLGGYDLQWEEEQQ